MMQFYIDGEPLAVVEAPVWIKRLDNGSLGLCPYAKAEGAVIKGVAYNLPGHSTCGQVGVTFKEVDLDDVIKAMLDKLGY